MVEQSQKQQNYSDDEGEDNVRYFEWTEEMTNEA
jgi:hypothetical protein